MQFLIIFAEITRDWETSAIKQWFYLTAVVRLTVTGFVIVAQEDAKAAAEKRLLEKKAKSAAGAKDTSAASWLQWQRLTDRLAFVLPSFSSFHSLTETVPSWFSLTSWCLYYNVMSRQFAHIVLFFNVIVITNVIISAGRSLCSWFIYLASVTRCSAECAVITKCQQAQTSFYLSHSYSI